MPVVTLDYPKAKLSIECNTPIEEKYRIHSVAKEPWTVEHIESLPAGSVYWDIGANTGAYSLIAVARGLHVIAIEPAFFNYAALCRNLAMNNMLDRCLVLCLALGGSSRYDWLHLQDTRAGAALHILGGQRKQSFHRQRIPVWTWDDLISTAPVPSDQPWHAKIDVDGGELAVLAGARQVLPRLQSLMIEMHLEEEQAISSFLTECGFKLAARFNERNGEQIPRVAYGRFERG